jgi:DNA-binding response OmpR family regulator
LVLIADGNTARGRRLAEACRRAGIAAGLASHGAAALEMALAKRPSLVVAEVDLPFVEGCKLAEIMRANPRTREAQFLYLGDEESLRARVRVGDWILPESTPPDELVVRIEEGLDRQERIESVDAKAEEGSEVDGELEQLPLADLLQRFHVNQRSGRLTLSREAENGAGMCGVILLRDGDVIRAEVGSVEGEKALFRLLAWEHGHFGFQSDRPTESPRIFAPTRALLVEGMRQIKEWDRLAHRLPPLDSPLKLKVKTSDLPNIVHPLTQEVLLLLEIYSHVRDVVDHCTFPDYQVLRTLHTLSEREIVQLGRVPIQGPVRVQEGLFTDAQARRLRDWLREESPCETAVADAKLVVVSSEPAVAVDFLNLMRSTPQIAVAPAQRPGEGPLPAGSLSSIGRVSVDDELGIEVFQLPSDARYSALWPLVGHGALAVLFLLSGPVASAAREVAPIASALQSLPKSRIFHVAMLRKEEGASSDDLKENADLIDETSLYLLSLEGGKEPAALLRGLFARVMP